MATPSGTEISKYMRRRYLFSQFVASGRSTDLDLTYEGDEAKSKMQLLMRLILTFTLFNCTSIEISIYSYIHLTSFSAQFRFFLLKPDLSTVSRHENVYNLIFNKTRTVVLIYYTVSEGSFQFCLNRSLNLR